MTSRRAVALLLVGSAACGGESPSFPMPTQAEWDVARARLEVLRRTEPTHPFGANVQVTLREPSTGRSFKARGALAVDPRRALRMILVGPGGGTAIDVWVTPKKWRLEIPPANLLRRGGLNEDAMLPIGFFRWWFLAPLETRLLTSVATRTGERFVLRTGAATTDVTEELHDGRRSITATRLAEGVTDRVTFEGTSFAMAAGDRATYDDESGVHVEVTVEAPSDAPDPEAFTEPDEGPRGAR